MRKSLKADRGKAVNVYTISMNDFLRTIYSQDIARLNDGSDLLDDYLANFGMSFRDNPDGSESCCVLDI